MSNTLIKSMLENAVHIGHKREYWSPKMRNYVYGVQNGIHVFDLYKTEKHVEEVKQVLADLTSKGKSILFVGTKIQTRDLVEKIANTTGQFYVNSKWVPGLLTNFSTLKKRIAYYNQLERDLASGILDNLTKKEKSVKLKELEKLQKAYAGVKDMRRAPDVVFVLDGRYEDLALTEARHVSATTISLLGSTGDIDRTDFFIPCNVNSIKALTFMMNELVPSIQARKKEERTFSNKTEKIAPRGGARPPRPAKNDEKTAESAE